MVASLPSQKEHEVEIPNNSQSIRQINTQELPEFKIVWLHKCSLNLIGLEQNCREPNRHNDSEPRQCRFGEWRLTENQG